MPSKDKLIIFDMDNTLIHSHMDFRLMKAETYGLLREAGLNPDDKLPVAQTLAELKQQNLLSSALEEAVWRKIESIEAQGLAEATLEPQVELVLAQLEPHAHLVVLTNTNERAAQAGLRKLGLTPWFEHIMGRGSAPQLKPAPHGMLALLAAYPHLSPGQALAVGDASIDIAAAHGAGLVFCAYNRSRTEDWSALPTQPEGRLQAWDKNSAAVLLALLGG